jgi:hypothetical protein
MHLGPGFTPFAGAILLTIMANRTHQPTLRKAAREALIIGIDIRQIREVYAGERNRSGKARARRSLRGVAR